MQQQHWVYTQPILASDWIIDNIPAGASGAIITHIITSSGEVILADHQRITPQGIELSFGVHEFEGKAYGHYFTNDVVIDGNGGSINVTINQHNMGGQAASQPYTFQEQT